MKMTYQYAVISLCDDMTDPDATSLPVAVLALGFTPQLRVAVVQSADEALGGHDVLVRQVLRDLPAMLRDHIDAIFATEPNASTHAVLGRLQRQLRNSLHVSLISTPKAVTVHAKKPRRTQDEVALRAKASFSKVVRDLPSPRELPTPNTVTWALPVAA